MRRGGEETVPARRKFKFALTAEEAENVLLAEMSLIGGIA